jgi:type III pantothenate kinase
MTLLVDIGNTRVKWARLLPDGSVGPQSASKHGGWSRQEWREAIFAGPKVDRVIVASVASDETDASLTAAAVLSGIADVRFVATTREAAGVRNGYADPAQLGVDRWVAAIGAYTYARGACIVADVGTAATIDVIGTDGQHLGGYIVPGPALMVASLLRATSDLGHLHAASGGPDASAGFADNTRDAIERGCQLAVAAFVDRCVADATRSLGRAPALFLTGGAAVAVLGELRSPTEHLPDLVLRGLASLAAATT